jgi:uncharacterized protein (DUF58 family)
LISPSRRAVLLVLAGAPVALVFALVAPRFWVAGPLWALAVAALLGVDGWLAPRRGEVSFRLDAPADLAAVGAPGGAVLFTAFAGKRPRRMEAALEVNAKLALSPARVRLDLAGPEPAAAAFALAPVRRGEGRVERAWARWTGPLGLLQVQASAALDTVVRVTPNLAAVRQEAMRLFSRHAVLGQKVRPDAGDGFEFHSLRDFETGMDVRAIDWKQSARHARLLAKQVHTEKNHPIMLALDAGRLMGDPVDGSPRLDRAINAALLIAYVALAMGDRVGLSAFDSRPRAVGRPVSGRGAFATLRHLAARVDYSAEETNFTLGLGAVGGALDRRALVVVFTEVADTTASELMIEAAGRLAHRHLLLFVLFEDAELEGYRARAPQQAPDVSRAVVADALLRERAVVIARLRRLGAEVVEAPAGGVGAALIDRYLHLKRMDRL